VFDRAVGLLVTIIGLAALAVIVSKRSQTAKVLDSLLGGLSKLIGQAVSPVTK
jgi:hypothetical protein